jgi:hypothetical protein
MRITVTLDDDVAAELLRLRKARDASFQQVVNEALRLGLKQMPARPRRLGPFRTKTAALGRCLIGSIDDVSEALAIAEGESFK